MYQFSNNIFVFHVDLVFLELFQFTDGTFFGTPCISLSTPVLKGGLYQANAFKTPPYTLFVSSIIVVFGWRR